MAVAGFDFALGTLTSATVTLAGSGTIATRSLSGTTATCAGEAGHYYFDGFIESSGVSVTSAYFNDLNDGGRSTTSGFCCITTNAGQTCNAGYSQASYTRSGYSTGTATTTSGLSNLADQSLTLALLTQPDFVDLQDGLATSNPTTSFNYIGRISVTFTCTPLSTTPSPVPLPASLPLLLAGIGALVELKLRRKSRG